MSAFIGFVTMLSAACVLWAMCVAFLKWIGADVPPNPRAWD